MADSIPDPELMAKLAAHKSLGSAPAAEHAWLIRHGVPRSLARGTIMTRKGEFATSLYVLFSGRVAIHMDRGAGSHILFEWRGGDVGGLLPFSRGARPPNDAVAEEDIEILDIPGEHLPEMIRECPSITATMVHTMLDRARQFNAFDLRDEKLVSLGRLAAGLAHELTNPAAAAARSASRLTEYVSAAESAATALGAAGLSDRQRATLEELRALCAAAAPASGRSALARADREDAIATWLAEHGAPETCAEPLAETAITIEALDRLAGEVQGEALEATLRWMAAGCQVRAVASEITMATARIRELVDAVKGFTFMDRAPTPEPVDIRRGIGDTLTMLGAKMRAKGAEVTTHFEESLPRAHAVGAELNQVWMNLIDNALDAIPAGGHVTVTASAANDRVLVRVIDDGPGIPAEILGRIFDPFFTTKDVGKGTGLGLDIVRRILRRHDGEVNVESRPGHTEFRVVLPSERAIGNPQAIS
jgi:signal transduction histidine kinase